jgi:hypothetical protein
MAGMSLTAAIQAIVSERPGSTQGGRSVAKHLIQIADISDDYSELFCVLAAVPVD